MRFSWSVAVPVRQILKWVMSPGHWSRRRLGLKAKKL